MVISLFARSMCFVRLVFSVLVLHCILLSLLQVVAPETFLQGQRGKIPA
jgi:hypothetical protein